MRSGFNAANIRRFHLDGKRYLDGPAPNEMARKARIFAKAFSDQELDDLIALCEANAANFHGNSTFGKAHIIRLLTIPQKRVRNSLLKTVLQEGWPVSRLDEEIANRFGARKRAGHHPTPLPRDLPRMLAVIEGRCLNWTRWLSALLEPVDDQEPIASALPEDLRLQLAQVYRLCGKLHAQAASEIDKQKAPSK